ncbi:sensor histidine kinase [Clostridium nigeriense]|uniref:sensor histidine kinase n=1 Tax=Clostridium nigeriense TaxID=1805470 RepID=UPI003D32AC06
MNVGFFDIISSFIQTIMTFSVVNYCLDKEYKKSKYQLSILITLITLIIIVVTNLMGNYSLSAIILHIIMISLIIISYKGDKLGGIIAFSITYLIMGITAIISISLFLLFLNNVSSKYINLITIIFMIFPQYIVSVLVLINMKFIYRIYMTVKSRVSSIFTLLIITVSVDFIISFFRIYNDQDNPIFKEIVFTLLGAFIIFITLYFANVDKKSNEILSLNRELEKKINELKKIKHDYGSQISYLYGAYLMGNNEKLGELLRGIIEGHDISSQVKVLSSEDSLIAQVVNTTDLKNIDILIDEKAKLEDTNISELDLQRIISNIVRNSIEALNGRGLLMIKSYYSFNHVIISIQNNGPEIEKHIIERIFEEGFSTKDNKNGDNGFGLYIVKEMIEKYNGTISVNSSEELTSFNIKLPLNIE